MLAFADPSVEGLSKTRAQPCNQVGPIGSADGQRSWILGSQRFDPYAKYARLKTALADVEKESP